MAFKMMPMSAGSVAMLPAEPPAPVPVVSTPVPIGGRKDLAITIKDVNYWLEMSETQFIKRFKEYARDSFIEAETVKELIKEYVEKFKQEHLETNPTEFCRLITLRMHASDIITAQMKANQPKMIEAAKKAGAAAAEEKKAEYIEQGRRSERSEMVGKMTLGSLALGGAVYTTGEAIAYVAPKVVGAPLALAAAGVGLVTEGAIYCNYISKETGRYVQTGAVVVAAAAAYPLATAAMTAAAGVVKTIQVARAVPQDSKGIAHTASSSSTDAKGIDHSGYIPPVPSYASVEGLPTGSGPMAKKLAVLASQSGGPIHTGGSRVGVAAPAAPTSPQITISLRSTPTSSPG